MTKEELILLIKKGENEKAEFKKATNTLPNSIWDSYSAFANTNGGVIILGINENKGKYFLTGVNDSGKIITEFWNQINNTQKVNSNILFNKNVIVENIDGKELIVISVPRANRQDKPIFLNNNVLTGTFRRNADGDYKCNTSEVKTMLRDQSDESADTLTFENVLLSDVITETFRRYRIRFKNLKPNHVWNNITDEAFLLKIGGLKRLNNKLIPTLAGIVVFCDEAVITSVLPNYFLDYREKQNVEDPRWVDRVSSNSGNWSGNIFDFYFMVIEKVLANAKVPFQLKGITRIDETPLHAAIREAIANTLIHADFYGTRGIVIEKLPNKLNLQNPGAFRLSIKAATQGGISDPRNTTIFKIFSLIGVGECAGSGLHSIHYVWENIGLNTPLLNETFSPSRVSFSIDWNETEKSLGKNIKGSEVTEKSSGKTEERFGVNENNSEKTEKSSGKTSNRILFLIANNNNITIPELAAKLKLGTRAIEKQIENLKNNGFLKRLGPAKGGCWEVVE